MQFISFRDGAQRGLAVNEGSNSWRGLKESDPTWPGDLRAILASGMSSVAIDALVNGSPVNLDSVTIDLPICQPGKVLCAGLNYAAHARESGHEIPKLPTVFGRFASGLIPHGAPIIRPKVSHMLDYEGELAVVIGKRGRDIDTANALDHVAGYTIFNDGSVRDWQLNTPQWTLGKNFDGTGALGPVMVTPDELPVGASGLRLRTRLNGELMQDTSTDDLIFSVAFLISHLSKAMTLEPGDIIATGTPSGVGGARKPQVWLKPGDVCEVEISGIGILRNTVADQQ